MASRQSNKLIAPAREQWIVGHEQRGIPLARDCSEGGFNFRLAVGIQNSKLLAYGTLCGGFLSDKWLGRPEPAALLGADVDEDGALQLHDPFECLEQRVDVLSGEVPESVEVREGPVTYDVDVRHGQKTGLFLDQRENREAAARYARGRLLDCFSYNGGFALYLARHCEAVHAIDQSGDAVARIAANAARNGLTNVTAADANVFDELRHYERSNERFDTIVLDPPAFAKNKASVEKAIAGYKDINLRALRILQPGGVLVTCSCSYNVDEMLFLQILAEAAADAHAHVTLLEKRMQGRDHPVLLTVPETYYLKCVILRKAA